MIRGLAQHITEADISDDIQSNGLLAKDIRLIRKKETGTEILRGFVIMRSPLSSHTKNRIPRSVLCGYVSISGKAMCDRNFYARIGIFLLEIV